MTNKIKTLDSLDLFLNKAHWSYKKYKSFIEIRSRVLIEFIEILNSKNLKYKLMTVKSKNNNLILNKREFDKFFINDLNKVTKLKDDLLKKDFVIYVSEENLILVLKNNIVFEINDIKSLSNKFKSAQYLLKDKNVNVVYANKFIFDKLKKIQTMFVSFIKKSYYRIKVIGFLNYLNHSKDNVYKLQYKNFCNLLFEPKDSINWLLRKKHLYLLTDNKKYLTVGSIVKHLQEKNNLTRKLENIIEADTKNLFDEPVHLNRYFWESGNNFFVYPAYFEFRKDVVPYKSCNKYIANNSHPMLYSFDYYTDLEKMNDKEIQQFLMNNPIEITDRHITSGRHRVAAMIGRLARNKPYINFYVKVTN